MRHSTELNPADGEAPEGPWFWSVSLVSGIHFLR
jgi:hypothetical protein